MSKLVEIIAWLGISSLFLGIGYITTNIILYKSITIPFVRIDRSEIVKNAVRYSDIKDIDHIVCQFTAITGFSFIMLKDENGIEVYEYVQIADFNPRSIIDYEFLISGNYFIFYVTEKNLVFDSVLQEYVVEYTIEGWDVLYPIRRQGFFNISPRYVLITDLR